MGHSNWPLKTIKKVSDETYIPTTQSSPYQRTWLSQAYAICQWPQGFGSRRAKGRHKLTVSDEKGLK